MFLSGCVCRLRAVGEERAFRAGCTGDVAGLGKFRRGIAVALLLGSALCAQTALAQVSFGPVCRNDFAVGIGPRSVAVGDFNGDGKSDLATANSGSDNVSVVLGDGAGGFSPAANFAVGFNPRSVAVGDFNGDGKSDLAVANAGSDSVSVLLGNGSGGFSAAANHLVGSFPTSVVVGDFNGDGKDDLAAVNSFSEYISVLLGNGSGGFGSATNYVCGFYSFALAVGDFNGDGKIDLVTANISFNRVSVLLGNGLGGFGAPVRFASGTSNESLAVSDFNGDGKSDLASADSVSNYVTVLLGDGLGSFASVTNFATGARPSMVVTGDFNGDGKSDLATLSDESNNVSVLLGDGSGGFATPTSFLVSMSPASAVAGDLNGDGKSDLATANYSSNNVSVLLGNGSGTLNLAAKFATGQSPSSVAVGDLNGDRISDLAVTNSNSDSVSVLLGDGSGGFGPATNLSTGSRPFSVAVGDFNADGKNDLAVASFVLSHVSVLLGDGAGGFTTAGNFAVGVGPSSVVTGDFNGDGKSDLVTANYLTNNVSVLLGNGSGGFGAALNYPVGGIPSSVAVGDFNSDGKSDLATANDASSNISVLLGNGSGRFDSPTSFFGGAHPTSLVVGDLNGDGKSDLAVADQEFTDVYVLLGTGSGDFSEATAFTVDVNPCWITMGDFNGDGKSDLATANKWPNNVSVVLGNGLGGFGAPTSFAVDLSPVSIAVGDFNGDGKSDLATANSGSNDVQVLYNRTDYAMADVRLAGTSRPQRATIGMPVDCELVVTNAGPDVATSVTLVDTLPGSATLLLVSQPEECCRLSSGSLVCELGNLEPGQATTVTVTFRAEAGGALVHTASVTANEADPRPSNNSVSALTLVSHIGTQLDDEFTTNSEDPTYQSGWSRFGINQSQLALSAWTSSYEGAYGARIWSDATRFRAAGWVANQTEWLPYSQVGKDNYVRVKYYAWAGGQATTSPLEIPNLRLRAQTRFAVNSMLEVLHHSNGDPDGASYSSEFRPSTDPNRPSLYRVDFDPVDVPYLESNAGFEGIQRAFEAYATDPQDNGYICVGESVIGTYPVSVLDDSLAYATGTRIYATTASDAGDLRVFNSATDLSITNLELTPGAGSFAVTTSTLPLGSYSEGSLGVTLDTSDVPACVCGVVTREFYPGDDPASAVRVEEGKQYKVRWHVTSTQMSNQNAQLRLRARACKFAWTQKYEIGGAWATGGTEISQNNAIAQQALPGQGCLNPDKNPGEENGGWYTMLVHSPLSSDIRADMPGALLSESMPKLSGCPGPGSAATSSAYRDLKLGCDLVDTLSLGANAGLERGSFTIDRIEVRTYGLVEDGGY